MTLLKELSEELVGYHHYDKFIRLIERLHARSRGVGSPSAVSPRRMTAYVAKVLWEEMPEPNKGRHLLQITRIIRPDVLGTYPKPATIRSPYAAASILYV